MDLMQWCPDFSNYWPSGLFQSRSSRAEQQLVQQFYAALQCDNLQLVKALLQLGMVTPDVKFVNRGRCTALHVACVNEQLEMVRLLFTFLADPNEINSDGVSPLMLAAVQGSIRLVRELLANGACARDVDAKGSAVLNYGLLGGCLEVVRALLEAGAGEAACDRLAAAWAESPATSLARLAADALGVAPSSGVLSTAAHYRLAVDHVTQRALVEKAAEGRADLLAEAARQGVSLDFIIDCDRELPQPPSGIPSSLRGAKDGVFCVSPAVAAVLHDRRPVLQLLHSLGTPLDSRDRLGFTPVFVAAALGRVDALSFLLASRCSASAKSHSGLTAAHLCALHCPPEAALQTLQLLLKRGAPADKADQSGKTPAHHFMDRGLGEPLRFLAGHRGCNPHRVLSPHGVSLLSYAVKCGWEAEVRLRLLDSSQRPNSGSSCRRRQDSSGSGSGSGAALLQLAAESGQRRVLETLFLRGVGWPTGDTDAAHALIQAAARRGDTKMLRLLVTRLGLPIDAADAEGETALTRATLEGRADTAELLLALGADAESGIRAATERVEDQQLFLRLLDVFDGATPQLWPSEAETPSGVDAELSTTERQVTLQILGRPAAYRVVEYTVTFSQPVDIFRKARQGDLPFLADIIADLGRRLPRQTRVTIRAFACARDAAAAGNAPSVEWPDTEYAAGLTGVKLRELLCQLHQFAALRSAVPPQRLRLDRVRLCVCAK